MPRCLDTKPYPKGLKVKPEEQARCGRDPGGCSPMELYDIADKHPQKQATYY